MTTNPPVRDGARSDGLSTMRLLVAMLGRCRACRRRVCRRCAGARRERRIELTPFGGIEDSGLRYKEGVQEAMKSFCNGKTFTLPW